MRMPDGFEAEGWTPETWKESKYNRFCDAYLEMAYKANYRPAAPGDGFGNIALTAEQVAERPRLELEALEYVRDFVKEEDEHVFNIGCSNYKTNRAFVWVIEAARELAGGADETALNRMAIAEINRARGGADAFCG